MKILKLIPVLMISGVLISGCDKPEKETILKGIYYLNNKTPYVLHIEARKNGTLIDLIADSIMDSTMTHFCTVFDGTGGHVMPSNFFTEFKVWGELPGGDSIFYEGVNNADWARNALTEEDIEYALTID